MTGTYLKTIGNEGTGSLTIRIPSNLNIRPITLNFTITKQ
jgi:hypothetical protein